MPENKGLLLGSEVIRERGGSGDLRLHQRAEQRLSPSADIVNELNRDQFEIRRFRAKSSLSGWPCKADTTGF